MLASTQALGERETGGFADLKSVIQGLQALGYSPEQIDFHLARAIDGSLIEQNDQGDAGTLVRVMPSGGYLHKKLTSSFPYIDAVIVDTPILDPSARAKIRDVFDIEERIARAEQFMNYLSECWSFGDDALAFAWPTVFADWEHAIDGVRRGAVRAAERRQRR